MDIVTDTTNTLVNYLMSLISVHTANNPMTPIGVQLTSQ